MGQFCQQKRFFFFFFWRKNGEENIALAEDHFSNQLTKWEWFRVLVEEKVQFEYAVCGRGSFWIRKEKFADSKISRYVWTGALEKCQTYRELTCCHCFFLQACSFDQLRRGSTQLCSEVDIVGVVVFCAPLSCLVVPVHLFNSMLSSSASSSSFFRCRPRHHHRHHGRHHHHYVTFNLTLLKKC